jgi:hypothetical protein
VPAEYQRAERQVFERWDILLTKLFQAVDLAPETSLDLSEKKIDADQVRGYRSRVGQDLKAFHEKLSNIMESEKSGQ